MGLGGSRKIQDILTDRKVPAAERDRLPIFVDAAGVLWIPGVALDERAAISGEGECVVRLTVEGLPAS
jgi:tRNA(Ile)-lysidine synthase